MTPEENTAARYGCWLAMAHPWQIAPADFRVWDVLNPDDPHEPFVRGAGKSRAAAEYIASLSSDPTLRLLILNRDINSAIMNQVQPLLDACRSRVLLSNHRTRGDFQAGGRFIVASPHHLLIAASGSWPTLIWIETYGLEGENRYRLEREIECAMIRCARLIRSG